MIKHSNFRQGYVQPCCEISEDVLKDFLCQSPDGTTENFGDLTDFEW